MNNNVQQFVQNQGIGTVIAALLRTNQYKRAAYYSDPGQFQAPTYEYKGLPLIMSIKTQEAYQLQADAPQHPIETGAVVSDHVILRPIRLELGFEVNNLDGIGPRANLAKLALDVAIEVWKSRDLFDIVTTHYYLKNMVCLQLTPENIAPEWGALRFRATFQQMSLVSLESKTFDPDNVMGGALKPSPQQSDSQLAATAPGGPANGKSVTAPGSRRLKGITQVVKSTDIYTPLSNAFFGRARGF
jgi:hypothetical protein